MTRIPLPKTAAGRAGLGLVVVAAALNLLVALVDAVAPSPGGRPSSSFATERGGFAAWAELARRNGHEVGALRRDPSEAQLPARGTIVVLDSPRLQVADARALRRFAEGGGHVVAGGDRPNVWLDALAGAGAPTWRRGGPSRAAVRAPAPEVAGVTAVETAGDGSWSRGGAGQVVLAGTDGGGPGAPGGAALLVVAPAGRGSLALLADSSPLQNRLLASADNAALALALAGEGPLLFAEAAHGYGEGRGLRALPAAWKWALGLALAAALALIAARGRRFGPPESRRRQLAPPRAAYVDAVAATLARSRWPDGAIAPVRESALELLHRRAGRAATQDELVAAARAAGIGQADAAALLRPAASHADAVAVARAHARLANGRMRSVTAHDEGGLAP